LNSKSITRQGLIKGFFRTILFIAIFLILLLAGIIVAVQIPFIQLKIVSKATDYLSKTLKFPIKIERVTIDWFDLIVLEGISVSDTHQEEMIYLGKSKIDFQVLSLLRAQVRLESISLMDGKVNLIKYNNGSLNMDDFIDSLSNLSPKSTDTTKKSTPFFIPEVTLENMSFSFYDRRKPYIKGFDHNHFELDSINAEVTGLTAIADTFKINIRNLNTYEAKTFLKVHDLDVDYQITKNKMEFKNLYAHIGESKVKNYLCFGFKRINEMSDFNEKVIVTSHLENSTISLNDLAFFAQDLIPYNDKARITGDFKGSVVNFGVKNLSFAFGKNSLINGNLKLKGLPDLEETLIEFAYDQLKIDTRDLKQYASKSAFMVLNKFGIIEGKGKFTGFPNDFVTHGRFTTFLGKFQTDINLKIHDDQVPKSYYKGHLTTTGFNFGMLTDKSIFGLLDMDGEIEGNGFTISDANVKLNAEIKRFGVHNYDYKNIKTNAELSERLFNGEISIDDSNLVLNAVGKVDLRENKNIFNIRAHLEKANLRRLHLNYSTEDALVKTDLYLDYTGLRIDDIEGRASFVNTYLLYNDTKEIFIDSLKIQSHKNNGIRNFSLESDLISAYVNGNFEFTKLLEDLQINYNEYLLSFSNKSENIQNYYRKKKVGSKSRYQVDFNIAIQNINPILAMYVPRLFISEGVFISGDFTSGYTSILNLHTNIDTLIYNENEIYRSEIELSASKIADSVNTLGMLYVRSERQKIKSFTATENFYFEGIWNNRTIDFQTRIKQYDHPNSATFMGKFDFLENKKSLSLHHSFIELLEQKWMINENNNITFSQQEVAFRDVSITNGNQAISIDGAISEDKTKESMLKVDNFKIENINPLLSSVKFKGVLNGTVLIQDLYKDIDLSGNILIDQFMVDQFLVGQVNAFAEYNHLDKMLNINIGIKRLGEKIIDIYGNIKGATSEKEESIALNARLDNANLELLNPLLHGVLTDISGKVSGDFTIGGTINKISLKGAGDVKSGKFKIAYLGTNYFFEDKIYMEENLIGFKKLLLNDENGNQAIVNGGLYHDGFKNFIVGINGAMKNFNVLNTKEEDNNLFYGTANVTGNIEILGAFSDLVIRSNATSNKGTKIFIPLNTTAGLEQKDFIKFKKFGTVKDTVERETVNLSGINLEFNFDITPDAYAEIIFDKRAGDIIRGYGQGNLKLTIDTRGDFSMYGTYRIVEGFYNFTLAGLINKEFKIKPNSSISWAGDPYTGLLDMDAVYTQYASLAPILSLDTAAAKKPENRRKYPTEVHLSLDGNLLSPVIALDVDILRYPPQYGGDIVAFENKLKTNEQELNRQVFSLLVLGIFSSENSFTGVSGSANNLSELLSNQLSNWLSQVDENLEIDINLNSLNRDALNTFQLRMTYTMLDGRLRITRDGTFQNVQSSQTNLTNIAGEWTIEYLLSQDGNLRLKLFNKANQNILLTSAGNSNTSSAGFSILHTQSFSNLKDLLNFNRDKSNKNELEELINTEELPLHTPPKGTDAGASGNPVNYVPPAKKDTGQEY
jgi:hypothetical protein